MSQADIKNVAILPRKSDPSGTFWLRSLIYLGDITSKNNNTDWGSHIRGSGGVDSRFRTISGQLHVPAAYLRKKPPHRPHLSFNWKADWSPGGFLTIWKREKFLSPARNRNPAQPSHTPQCSHQSESGIPTQLNCQNFLSWETGRCVVLLSGSLEYSLVAPTSG